MTLLTLLCVSLLSQTAAETEAQAKLLVADLAAQGVADAEAAAMTDAVVTTLQERGMFRVLSSKDVQTILGAERRRQLGGGCAPGKDCAADLGTALGARFVLTGALAQIGGTYQLTLQVVDTVRSERLGQSSRLAKELTTLRLLMPYAVAEATGSPLPPPPSRVWQYTAISAGAGAVVAGGVLGMLALTRQRVLNDELCPSGVVSGACSGVNLRPLSYYQGEQSGIGRDKTIALAMMAAGAGLVAVGLIFMPPPEGGPRVALSVTGQGAAVAGEFW
ncbi:MAG: hypothetical protein ACKVPX_14755 [Myxococcaceae bacterium]